MFDGRNGVIYASLEKFQDSTSLFIGYAHDNKVHCAVFDNTDGLMLTDTLSFNKDITVSLGKVFDRSCIIADRVYVLKDDQFIISNDPCTKKADIMSIKNGKISPMKNTAKQLNSFLNELKQPMICDYSFPNIINSIPQKQKEKMHSVISACADIMSYSYYDYNYDKLFCDVLISHNNFRILTDKNPDTYSPACDIGYRGVYKVNAEFIDEIMNKYFEIIPEKPPVNALLERGYCYCDGAYLYTDKYDVNYRTDVGDFAGIYDIGNNIYYCIFKDTYTENGIRKPEYSYCFLENCGDYFCMLEIGMGKPLPDDYQLKKYAQSFYAINTFESVPYKKSYTIPGIAFAVIIIVSLVLVLKKARN